MELVHLNTVPAARTSVFTLINRGVTLDDCETVSRAIRICLTPTTRSQSYILEVSSPG